MSDPGRTIARELAEQGARYPNAGASAILSALVKDGYAVVELPNVSRDDLARIAEILRDRFPFVSAAGLGEIAAEIGAALRPRIDTMEQLDALPFLTIVREVYGPSPRACDYGAVWERRTSGWQCIAGSVMPPRDEHAPRLGCRVLYTPEPDALRDQETTHA